MFSFMAVREDRLKKKQKNIDGLNWSLIFVLDHNDSE